MLNSRQIYSKRVRKNCTQLFYMLNIRFLFINNYLKSKFYKGVKNQNEKKYDEEIISCKLFTVVFHNVPNKDIA